MGSTLNTFNIRESPGSSSSERRCRCFKTIYPGYVCSEPESFYIQYVEFVKNTWGPDEVWVACRSIYGDDGSSFFECMVWVAQRRVCSAVLNKLREGLFGKRLAAVEFPLPKENWHSFMQRVFGGRGQYYYGEQSLKEYLEGVPGEIQVKGSGRSWRIEEAGVWKCRDEDVRGVRIGDVEGMGQVLEMKKLARAFAEAEIERCQCANELKRLEIEEASQRLEMKTMEARHRQAQLGVAEAELCFNSMKVNGEGEMERRAGVVNEMMDMELKGLARGSENSELEDGMDWGDFTIDEQLDMFTNGMEVGEDIYI